MMSKQLHVLFFVLSIVLCPSLAVAQEWVKLATSNNPPERVNHTAVFDPIANRMLIFGGKANTAQANNINVNDLWSLDLTTLEWSEITPSAGPIPAPRFTHNAVFDSARNRMIIWSGQGNSGAFYNDVWAFDFSLNRWEQLWTNGNTQNAPNQRYGTTAQFDPLSRQLINIAGFTVEGRFADTWSFQVDTLLWYNQTSNSTLHPQKRCLHSSCFAFDRRALFLYGGQTDGIHYLDDLWVLNVDTFVWEPHSFPNAPIGRHFTSLTYDGSEHLYVFGGITFGEVVSNEFWMFSLQTNTWKRIFPVGEEAIPEPRYGHTAIYVTSRNSMVIFGGMRQNNLRYNDTWEYPFSKTTTGVEQSDTPAQFELRQNYPNPFNPVTTIAYHVTDPGRVTLKIFDMLGRELTTLVDETQQPGTYHTTWNATQYPSGLYYYTLRFSRHTATRTMLLLK